MEESTKSYMVGSCHQHQNGYGYGTRVPTERNNPSTPSIPKYRIHPDYAAPITGSRSRDLGYSGPSADMRQAQSLAFQTSGDYGKFLFPVETKVSRARSVPTSAPMMSSRVNNNMTDMIQYQRSTNGPSRPLTTGGSNMNKQSPVLLMDTASRPQSHNRLGRTDTSTGNPSSPYRTLDASLPGHCKFDLMASTTNSRPSELGWSINTNLLAHNKSIGWRGGLRHQKKPSTPVAGTTA
jgi:hypothetical protein